ncbi:tyrosine-type recombinase/integrase [Melissococcus plutonius]|uniref:tyrosine-type recombinase/integrase n=3 Tax=Melissococcus plutonius TaxID=33970 RepID=UPI003C2AF667
MEGKTMATIKQYTKKDGSKAWQFQTYLGINQATGKEIRTTRRNFKTKKEAQLELNRLLVDYEKNGLQKKEKITYQELYDEWIIQYKNTVKESTFVKTKRIFKNHILPYFGQMRIETIEIKHCQDAINQWSKSLKRFKTIMNYAGMIFDYAIRIGLIALNPTKLVTRPIVKDEIEEKESNFYTKEELTLFFNYLEKENEPKIYTLFRILAFTGMRKGEALALTWNDINFEQQTITINKTLTRGEHSKLIIQTPKTGNSKRVVSIDDKTLSILKQWRTTQKKQYFILGFNTMNKQQLIFSNLQNDYLQPTITRKYIKLICEKYELKEITTHGFRHTHCSLLFESGATMKEVQDRLGHSDVKTTMNIYAHVTKDYKEKTAKVFAAYIGI